MNGMWDAVTCAVCSEVYQAGTREPLVLPCGHTFCRTCVTSFRRNSSFLCPTCRQIHTELEEEELYVSYSLLSLASDYKNSQDQRETCSEHGDEQRYWCFDCKLQLCSLCLYSGHPQGHNVKLVTTYIAEKKKTLSAQLEAVNHEIKSLQENVKINFSGFFDEVATCLGELCQAHNSLHDFQDDVTQVLNKVTGHTRIKVIEATETKLQNFQAQLQEYTKPDEEDKELQEYTKPDEEDKDCSVTNASSVGDTLTNQSVKESDASPGIHQEVHPSPETVYTADDTNRQENDCADHDTSQDEESVHFNTDGYITEDQKNPTDRGPTPISKEKNLDFGTKNEISRTTPFQFGQKVSCQGFDFFKSYRAKGKLTNANMLHFSGQKNAWTSSVYGHSDKKISAKKIATHGLPANSDNMILEGSQEEDDGVKSTRLDYQDGRLLLHCLAKPTETCLSLQLPSEVFLELSAGDKCLGLVYISLWSQQRRAQQLLALCVGNLGPSYLGAKGRVIQTNSGKYLSFHYYHSSDGLESSQPIFTNLEWGSTYKKPIKEGLVMHSKGDDNFIIISTNIHDFTCFSICVESPREGYSQCPFGEVVAGMEVLEAAGTQKDSTITITQCGLVLPRSVNPEPEQPSCPFSFPVPVGIRIRRTGRRSFLIKSGRARRR